MPRKPFRTLLVVLLMLLPALALTELSYPGAEAAPGPAGSQPAARHAAHRLVAHGSARQVYATGLTKRARVTLVRHGHQLRTQRASNRGAILFRDVAPGRGYRLRTGGHTSKPVTVHTNASKPWDPAVYHQRIPDTGYGYLTTRDGTKLAYSVHLPTNPATLGIGLPSQTPLPNGPDYLPPYPTLIEYSGYGYATPAGPQNGIAVIANLMGFAVVDINMRGTGCSGGAYDFFEPLQSLDAYDAIETIARQPWVKGHTVGMMGISYGAISQLFTAATHPPHLSAISPLSTIDASATTLLPGGILNDGFALNWAKERIHDARPSGPHGGQDYAREQIRSGDKVCAANQDMHSQALNLLKKIHDNEHYVPKVADQIDPITFVHKIHVPTFLACQFQDEQTGGHCPDLVRHFTGTQHKWFHFTNGAHIDSLDPTTFNRWYDFLEIYVAHQAPALNAAAMRAVAPVFFQVAMGLPHTDVVTLPSDPIQQMPSLAAAKKAFEASPRVTIDFDNGAGASPSAPHTPGNPVPGYTKTFPTFPVPHTKARSWYLAPGGRLSSSRPRARGADSFIADPRSTPLNSYRGNTGTGGLWGNASQWTYQWKQNRTGTALSYLTQPLTKDTTVIGGGALYLWVRSSTPDVDLQATISEVRPDGKETFVQNGWQRAGERRLAGRHGSLLKQPSTLLEPFPTVRASDVAPMPRHRFVKVAIPLYYQGHGYRKGSRIRITISGPNGTQPIWNFVDTEPEHGTSHVDVGLGRVMASRLVLPVVPGLGIPTALPPCPGLRNEPCRTYRPLRNHG